MATVIRKVAPLTRQFAWTAFVTDGDVKPSVTFRQATVGDVETIQQQAAEQTFEYEGDDGDGNFKSVKRTYTLNRSTEVIEQVACTLVRTDVVDESQMDYYDPNKPALLRARLRELGQDEFDQLLEFCHTVNPQWDPLKKK